MSIRLVVIVACLAGVLTAAMLRVIFLERMISEINRKRSDANLVRHSGFRLDRWAEVQTDYKDLYPSGRLPAYYRTQLAISIAGLGFAAFCVWMVASR